MDTSDSNSPIFRAHGLLMSAVPDSEESKAKLIGELKSRGNQAFKMKRYDEADALYTRALEHDPTVQAILGNRSAARLFMHRCAEALVDAEAAIAIDDNWDKGHFRKAQAHMELKEYRQAHASFMRASELKPTDKALPKLAQKALDAANKAEHEAKMKASKTSVEPAPAPAPAFKPPSKTAVPKKTSSAPSKVEPKDSGEEKIRGYKILADGRKTTFFNNELSEKDKELIGDITPKKLENAEAAVKVGAADASAWNHAGTFEAKTYTSWAKARVVELISATTFTTHDDLTIKCTEVTDFDGDAQSTFSRGKRKHMYDFTFTVKWSCECEGKTVKGELAYEDVGNLEVDQEYEVQAKVTSKSPPQSFSRVFNKYIKSSSEGLQDSIRVGIKTYEKEFYMKM